MPDKLTNIGTILSVSASLPATEDVAGYGALTFTEVTGVATVPELGAEYEVVRHVDVKDGITRKGHGAVDYGGGTVVYRVVESDAGQGILETAMDGKDTISFQVERPSGLLEYFQGIVTRNRTSEASSGNTYTVSSALDVTSLIVKDSSGV